MHASRIKLPPRHKSQFSLFVLVIIPLRLAKREAIHLRKNVLPWFIPVPVPTGTQSGQVPILIVPELVSFVVTGGVGVWRAAGNDARVQVRKEWFFIWFLVPSYLDVDHWLSIDMYATYLPKTVQAANDERRACENSSWEQGQGLWMVDAEVGRLVIPRGEMRNLVRCVLSM